MKKIFTLLSFPVVLLLSCAGNNTYTLETFYTNAKGNGDTSLISEKDDISAESDSVAYIKAAEKFNNLMAKSGDKHGMPVKFTLRNHKGVIVADPSQQTDQDRNAYPNQKSPD